MISLIASKSCSLCEFAAPVSLSCLHVGTASTPVGVPDNTAHSFADVLFAVHYHLDSRKLAKLGWREQVSWEDGLKHTIDWYRVNSGNWGDLSSALVAHPRRGLTPAEVAGEIAALETPKAVPMRSKPLGSDEEGVIESFVVRRPARLAPPTA